MKLTILMYHKVDELRPGVRYPGNYVAPRAFEQQMNALTMWGYRTIRLDEWIDYREGRVHTLPEKPLVVSFDDGYTCFDRNAWPVLRARGMRAVVFLVGSQIGGYNAWDKDERREPLLSATRIRDLQREGVDFGSHTHSHLPLAKIDPRKALDELMQSRAEIGEVLGRAVTSLAYPFSNQSETVRKLARDAGYSCAVRGKGRMNSTRVDPFGLRRIKVEPSTTVQQLRRVLFRERYLRVF
jgi:peptidoglycan/xylan/chitin deacetylase (PgdA/CDA1 family)